MCRSDQAREHSFPHRYAAETDSPPGVLAWVLLVAVVAVLIANSIADSGAVRVSVEPVQPRHGTPVGLAGGFQGTQRHGVVHAPSGYSPPGLWRAPNGGPVVR
jgi:hypothetical protein